MSSAELLQQAMKRRKELELAHEIDLVEDRQPPSSQVPLDNSLLGVELEVRWRYRNEDTGEPVYIWVSGEVVQACLLTCGCLHLLSTAPLCRWLMERER